MLGLFRRLVHALNWIAVASLISMMFLTSADIVLRLFGRPITGTYELVGFLGAVAIGLALAETTAKQGHVAVEVVVTRLPRSVQKAFFLTTHTLSMLLFALCAWESVRYGTALRQAGEVSPSLQFPFYPILYGIAVSTALVSGVLLVELARVVTGRGEPWHEW